MAHSNTERIQAEGARSTEEVTWGKERTILHNGAYYAGLPGWAIINTGLDDGDTSYVPGYSPAGQTVIVEEEAIIIRPVDGDGDE